MGAETSEQGKNALNKDDSAFNNLNARFVHGRGIELFKNYAAGQNPGFLGAFLAAEGDYDGEGNDNNAAAHVLPSNSDDEDDGDDDDNSEQSDEDLETRFVHGRRDLPADDIDSIDKYKLLMYISLSLIFSFHFLRSI